MKPKLTLLLLTSAAALLSGCVETYSPGGPSAGAPGYRPGYVVTTLPQGYRAEVISGTRYYYHDNVYYRPQGRGYVVVQSPRHGGDWDGRGRDRDRDGGRHDGDRDGGRGDGDRDRGRGDRDRDDRDHGHRDVRVIRSLPNGYAVVNHRGQRYYRSGNAYYQSRDGGYVVVSSPF